MQIRNVCMYYVCINASNIRNNPYGTTCSVTAVIVIVIIDSSASSSGLFVLVLQFLK